MDSLEYDYVKKKKIYREIFKKSQDAVLAQLQNLGKVFSCFSCNKECELKGLNPNLLTKYPAGCCYREWQALSLMKLKDEIARDVYFKIQELLQSRCKYSCARCAVCCRFACSEFSYEELKQRAAEGDKFAAQFISVFVPYENFDEAAKIYPEYIELLKNKYGDVDSVHFYHCPKLSDDNLCTDYENRPDICRDFPTNALAILPISCGFKGWKDENEILALTLHSLSEIVDFCVKKIEENLLEED